MKRLFPIVGLALLTGCAGHQIIDTGSWSGAVLNATVPVPGTSVSFLSLGLKVGSGKSSNIIQPISTNGPAPSVAINQSTYGSTALNAGGTNVASGNINAGAVDTTTVLTGLASGSITNSRVSGTLNSGK